MTGYERYAIYWVPREDSALSAFAGPWFANASPAAGERKTYGLPADLALRATTSPARYGLHATLKAPFRLRGAVTQAELESDLGAFCAKRRQVKGGYLRFAKFQRYLGLVLTGCSAEADWLAAECVTHFDRFRAPLSQEDRERREPAVLTETEAAFFESFGYPHVLSTFEFHVTLAGPLESDDLARVEEALALATASLASTPLRIEDLSLLGEAGHGSGFSLLRRFPFMR
jgi:hypothetical protein